MTLAELQQLLTGNESASIEFKEWKTAVPVLGAGKWENRRCLLGYCVAIGNEGGGVLVIGVNDLREIVGTGATLSGAEKQIYDHTGQKIRIEEVSADGKRVLVVQIPSRPVATLLKFAGVPLMRIADSLEVMSDAEQKRILLEGQEDFSARLCDASSLASVDREALNRLRDLYRQKHPDNTPLASLPDAQFLTDIALVRDGKLTYAGVILLAQEAFLQRHLPDAEICFEYRNRAGDLAYNDRQDYRSPFVLAASAIWEKVASRQQIHPFVDGLFRREIPAFNEEVFREAMFNAVCHRDYTRPGSVFIRQSPEEIEITNPGGFPPGVTQENILYVPSTPRNRLLAEVFQKILPGVERSGQGADKIFRLTIEEGKGMPSYDRSDAHHVFLTVPAMLKDRQFVQYLEKISNEKQFSLSLPDLLLLERIREGDLEGVTRNVVGHLLEQGLIESHGKTRGAKYILATRYYTETGTLGERTRRLGLSKEKRQELILEHVRRHEKGTMTEFRQIFPELTRNEIANLVRNLKNEGKIRKSGGATNTAYWVLVV